MRASIEHILLPLSLFGAVEAAACTSTKATNNTGASACTGVRPRVPWTSLTEDEKNAYIAADLCLINMPSKSKFEGAVTRWDDLQWPHVAQSSAVHFTGAFLPFHRYYMTAHERMIKDECGYTGRMPYWDELADIDDISSSDLWNYFGGNGSGDDHCFTDGPFANLTLRWLTNGSTSDHCLTREFNQTAFEGTKQSNIDKCLAISNYTDAWECYNGGTHTGGHLGVNGTMTDGTLSPGDPVFFLHHSWLDLLFWNWQKEDLPARYYDMGGPDQPTFVANTEQRGLESIWTDYFGDGGNTTTLNHRLNMVDLYPNITIGDVMDLNGDVICSEYLSAEEAG
ncbi:hypothetical protein PFICI_12711 [Pestalotiopsis fici W106-1]|uniref:Tyrosinase copper-binding domain-containing protein n=1 Tax=Pestalotiopsis fici (strain W106-1 / CGMCC3.15140) TaxID=1229662 RepID=W3WRL5_PESFW|nr:uncharacterized protein PFICI_12711 [Pestalotiopsis fici W106-1]ETS75767.1 hypothetical protein PFICI_12711 [Pestalotiopsis fici W106-1]